MHTLIATASALIAAATASGGLQLPADGPATFDVAGVRLDMAPDAVRAALARTGYHVTRTGQTLDFAQLTTLKANERRRGSVVNAPMPKGVGVIEATGPHGELVNVTFAQIRGGARANAVTLSVGVDRQDSASFMQQVAERYGKATMRPNALEGTWCATRDKCDPLTAPRSPFLRVSGLGPNVLTLDAGPDVAHAAQADFDAEVDRLAPRTGRSAF